jgi:hypothetical protein
LKRIEKRNKDMKKVREKYQNKLKKLAGLEVKQV